MIAEVMLVVVRERLVKRRDERGRALIRDDLGIMMGDGGGGGGGSCGGGGDW